MTVILSAIFVICGAFLAIAIKTKVPPEEPVGLTQVYALNESVGYVSFITDVDASYIYQVVDLTTLDENGYSTVSLQGVAVNGVSVPVTNSSFATALTPIRVCPHFGRTSFIVGDLFVTWFPYLSGIGAGNTRMSACNMSLALSDAERTPPVFIQLPSFYNNTYDFTAMRTDPTSSNITIFVLEDNPLTLLQFNFRTDTLNLTLVDSFTITPPDGSGAVSAFIVPPPAGPSASSHLISVASYIQTTYQLRIETFSFVPGTGRTASSSNAISYQAFVGTVAVSPGSSFLALAPPYIYTFLGPRRGIVALPLTPYVTNAATPVAASIASFPSAAYLDHPFITSSTADVANGLLRVDPDSAHLVAVYAGDRNYPRAAVFEIPAKPTGALSLKWNRELEQSDWTWPWWELFGIGTNVWALTSNGYTRYPWLLSVVYDP
ncbi:hypothetical protein DFJ73DRAFT_832614 [Zopfochytrium polystomum]|nr:hypothetical protein DFJ73DRAFT_832614 [Zopfochytrium polystomum]